MKKIVVVLALLCVSVSSVCAQEDTLTGIRDMGKLTVLVHGFMKLRGNVLVALYDSSVSSLRNKNILLARKLMIVPVTSDPLKVVFEGVTPGRYAVEAFHDENGDSRYEYLKEDYAYSNHVSITYGPVTFKKASFRYYGRALTLPIFFENANNGRSFAHYSNKTALAPVFGYSPETSFMVGGNIVKLFKFNGTDTLTRTSYIDVFGSFTFKKQMIFEQNYTLFTNHEKYIFTGFTGFQKYPQYYFGVGNDLPTSNKESITYNNFRFEHLAMRQIHKGKKLFVGLGYRYVSLFGLKSDPEGTMATSKVTGYQGSILSGIQPTISSDNRDNIYNASVGHLLRIKTTLNSTLIGSSYNFQVCEMDYRRFLRVFKNRYDVLAFQAYGYFSSGDVPWNEMGALGSDMIMRGYYSGRYRDKNYVAAQAEYRLVLDKMFGLTVFTAVGEVAHEIKSMQVRTLKPTAGMGVRVCVDRKERLNLRFDMGFGQNTSNFYFTVTEAF